MEKKKYYYALMYYKEEWILEKLELLYIMDYQLLQQVNLKKKGIYLYII